MGTIICRLKGEMQIFQSAHQLSACPFWVTRKRDTSQCWCLPCAVEVQVSVTRVPTAIVTDQSLLQLFPFPLASCSDCILSPSLGKSCGGGVGAEREGRGRGREGSASFLPTSSFMHDCTVGKFSPLFGWHECAEPPPASLGEGLRKGLPHGDAGWRNPLQPGGTGRLN